MVGAVNIAFALLEIALKQGQIAIFLNCGLANMRGGAKYDWRCQKTLKNDICGLPRSGAGTGRPRPFF